MVLTEAQKIIAKDTHRFRVVCAGRRGGKTYLACEEIKGKALAKPSKIAYIATTYGQARDIAWESLRKELASIIIAANESRLEIRVKTLKGGESKIVLRGWESVETLRGQAFDFLVIDEVASMKNFWSNWQEVLVPTLTDTAGEVLFISCITKDTWVLGENGLQRIGDCPNGFSDYGKNVYGLGGFHKAEYKYGTGFVKTKKIKTKFGFEIECSLNHMFHTLDGWKRADSFSLGEQILLQYNQNVFGNDTDTSGFKYKKRKPKVDFETNWSQDMAYLFGLILAEGNWSDAYIDITNGDEEIQEFLIKRFGFKKGWDKFHYRLSSCKAVDFLNWVGMPKGARNKYIPDKILRLPKILLSEFLKGYFDGDGYAHSKRPKVGCVTTSYELAKQLQILLLNFGVLSKRRFSISKPSKLVKSESGQWSLEIENYASAQFFKNIGFRLSRKQKYAFISDKNTYKTSFNRKDWGKLNTKFGYLGRENKIEINTLKNLLSLCPNEKYKTDLICDEILEISDSENNVYDYHIPTTHSFFSNGMISHNTPKGFNHFYDLYNQSLKDKAFNSHRFTSYDNPHIEREEIDSLKGQMTPERFAQEYMADFTKTEGLVYKEFRREKHLYETLPDGTYDKIAGVDFGYTNPAAVLHILTNGEKYYIEDEWYKTKRTEAQIAEYVAGCKFDEVYPDPESPSAIEELRRVNVNTREVSKGKDSVASGIQKIRELFLNNQLFINNRCLNLIYELETYSYDDDSEDRNKKEKPVKQNDHALDALRYVILMRYGLSGPTARDLMDIQNARNERKFEFS